MDEKQPENTETGEKRAVVDNKHPPVEHRFGPGNKAAVGAKHTPGSRLMAKLHKRVKWQSPQEYRDKLKQKYPEHAADIDKMTDADAILDRFVRSAAAGAPWAVKEYLDRIVGPVGQKVDHTTQGQPIMQKIYHVQSIEQQNEIEELDAEVDEI